MADDKKARELLEKLRRLPHNKRCANCDKEAPPGGHGDICVKFGTFVCHTCKSAHQAYSHRCKSVTLSNWTTHEVLALKDEAGGGNAHSRQTWLGQLEKTGLVLRPESSLDEAKAFVDACYNHKRYYKDPEGAGAGPRPTTQRNHSGATPSSAAASSGVRPPTPPSSSSKHATDDMFDPRGPVPAASGATAATDFLDFAADFGEMQQAAPAPGLAAKGTEWQPFSQAAPVPAPAAAPAANSAFAFIAAPPPAPTSDFGDFMAATPAPAPAPASTPAPMARGPQPVMLTSARAFDDPFAGLSSTAHHGPAYGGMPPRPAMGAMGGMGGMPFPNPSGRMQMQPPAMNGGFGAPPGPMGMSTGGAPPANGIPNCGFVLPSGPGPRGPPMAPPQQYHQHQQQPRPPMGMGMGMGTAGGFPAGPYHHKAQQEPDPFAALDAAWRNK